MYFINSALSRINLVKRKNPNSTPPPHALNVFRAMVRHVPKLHFNCVRYTIAVVLRLSNWKFGINFTHDAEKSLCLYQKLKFPLILHSQTRISWYGFSARLFFYLPVIWHVNGKCLLRDPRWLTNLLVTITIGEWPYFLCSLIQQNISSKCLVSPKSYAYAFAWHTNANFKHQKLMVS